jgi:dephospho-CoA kinase
MPSDKLVIGLTGGIGSGKSTVAALFAKLGVTIIDTDVIAREITETGTDAYQKIIDKFGATIVADNKKLDRRALRKFIFDNNEHRLWLEKLLHPQIREEMRRQLKLAASPYAIAVIPLLLEGSPNPLISRVLVVDAPEALQLERTRARDQQSDDEVKSIMKAQILRSKRLARADDVILNDGKLVDLKPQIEKLHKFYLTLCQPSSTSG